jgi:hypothetical protein
VRLGHLGSSRTSTWWVLCRHKMAIQLAKPHLTLLHRQRMKPCLTLATQHPCRARPCGVSHCLPRSASQVKVALNATPPWQKAATKRSLPIRRRRIVAQPLAHIPTSKWGEVLLMQRLGIVPLIARVSSASKGAYDAIFTGNLTPSHVAALNKLFPATSSRTSRRALFSDGKKGSRNQ